LWTTGKVAKMYCQEKYLQGKVVRMTGKVTKTDCKGKYLQIDVMQTHNLLPVETIILHSFLPTPYRPPRK
jgi:hypothetical protein